MDLLRQLCSRKHQKDRAAEDKKSKDLTPTSRGGEPEEGGRHRDNKGDKPGKEEKAKKGEKKDKDRSKDKEKGKRGHGGHEDEENAASTSSSHRRSLEPPPMDDRGEKCVCLVFFPLWTFDGKCAAVSRLVC